MSPIDLFISLLKTRWPGGTTLPTAGARAGYELYNANANIAILAQSSVIAFLSVLGSEVGSPVSTFEFNVVG